MNSIIRLVAVVAGLVLLLNSTPSWGQPVCASPGCNSTVSDDNLNTAGGSGALANVNEDPTTGGFSNTAFGHSALNTNTTGVFVEDVKGHPIPRRQGSCVAL